MITCHFVGLVTSFSVQFNVRLRARVELPTGAPGGGTHVLRASAVRPLGTRVLERRGICFSNICPITTHSDPRSGDRSSHRQARPYVHREKHNIRHTSGSRYASQVATAGTDPLLLNILAVVSGRNTRSNGALFSIRAVAGDGQLLLPLVSKVAILSATTTNPALLAFTFAIFQNRVLRSIVMCKSGMRRLLSSSSEGWKAKHLRFEK